MCKNEPVIHSKTVSRQVFERRDGCCIWWRRNNVSHSTTVRLVVFCMVGTAAMALADYEEDHSFATKILANALVCRLSALACNNPLAPTSSPSNFVGLGLFIGLLSGLSACFRLVRSTSDEAVGVATASRSTNIMGGL